MLIECTEGSPQPTGCGARNQAAEPFLCFARRTPGDVLLDGSKIAGSAQRRHHGAVLQHGSILFERSPLAPEVPGLQDLTTARLDGNDFASRLRNALAQRLRIEFTLESVPADLTAEAALIEASKFATNHWLRLR
jgi:lipoate-protein ligase A